MTSLKPDVEYHEIKTKMEVLFLTRGPDLTDTVTGRTVIPERVLIRLYRLVTPEQDSGREWAHVHVYGPRRLKSGEAGQEISSFGWESTNGLGPTYVDRPEWLTQAIADHLPDGWNPALLGLKGAAPAAPVCDCGAPIPEKQRRAYCSDRCRWDADDHGPNGDDQ